MPSCYVQGQLKLKDGREGYYCDVFSDFNLDSVDSNQQTQEILSYDWQLTGCTPAQEPQISLASLWYKSTEEKSM